MPLIKLKHRPGFRFPGVSGRMGPEAARTFLRQDFGRALPAFFARYGAEFGIDVVPEAGVQVECDTFGEDDINVPDLWLDIRLSEEPPGEQERIRIRRTMYAALTRLLRELGKEVPDFVIDVSWGPSSGQGTVDGELIEW